MLISYLHHAILSQVNIFMISIVTDILKALGNKLAIVIIALAKASTSIVNFLENRRKDKKEQEKKEEKAKKEKKTDDVCDNGTV